LLELAWFSLVRADLMLSNIEEVNEFINL